jgi:hypothetical protein
MIVRKTTPLYKKKILSIVICITKFQSDLLNKKNSFFVLIVNLQKKFYKKMSKILLQNRFLPDDKLF